MSSEKCRSGYPFFVDKTFLVGIVSKSDTEMSTRNIRKKEGFMSEKKKISRREFMKKAGTVGAAVALTGGLSAVAKPARAATRDFILIGHPNPSTGPIASFGEASPWADELAIEEINKQGGIFIKEAGK